MAIYKVYSESDLMYHMESIVSAGDTIEIAAGQYTNVLFKDHTFETDNPVTITYAEGIDRSAVFFEGKTVVQTSQGLTFDGIAFKGTNFENLASNPDNPGEAVLQLKNSNNIAVKNSLIEGTEFDSTKLNQTGLKNEFKFKLTNEDGSVDYMYEGHHFLTGVSVSGGQNNSLVGSTLAKLGHGMILGGGSSKLQIRDNTIDDIREDGIRGTNHFDTVIADNSFSNFNPARVFEDISMGNKGRVVNDYATGSAQPIVLPVDEHGDMIQFWAKKFDGVTDLTISGNIFFDHNASLQNGTNVQAIRISHDIPNPNADKSALGIQNVNVHDNVLFVGHNNAIQFSGVVGGKITDNTLISNENPNDEWSYETYPWSYAPGTSNTPAGKDEEKVYTPQIRLENTVYVKQSDGTWATNVTGDATASNPDELTSPTSNIVVSGNTVPIKNGSDIIIETVNDANGNPQPITTASQTTAYTDAHTHFSGLIAAWQNGDAALYDFVNEMHTETINGDGDDNDLAGGSGHDDIYGKGGSDNIYAGLGDDTVDGGSGHDMIFGGKGNDVLAGSWGSDSLDGGGGNDDLSGGSGSDNLAGGTGNDTLDGLNSDDKLFGGAGNDFLLGGRGRDLLNGDNGDDTLDGGESHDLLKGGSGADVLLGGSNNDTLDGGEGDDDLNGGNHSDTLDGGEGADIVNGGSGSDTLIVQSGEGGDILTGSFAADTFVFYEGFGTATITDFARGTELIELLQYTSVQNFADIGISYQADHTVLDFGGGDLLVLEGITTGLNDTNFDFG